MSRVGDIQRAFENGEHIDRQNIAYLFDMIETCMSFALAEAILPEDLCEPCPYKGEGIDPSNCEQPMDDCQEPMILFFEDALNTWLSTRNNSEEVE